MIRGKGRADIEGVGRIASHGRHIPPPPPLERVGLFVFVELMATSQILESPVTSIGSTQSTRSSTLVPNILISRRVHRKGGWPTLFPPSICSQVVCAKCCYSAVHATIDTATQNELIYEM